MFIPAVRVMMPEYLESCGSTRSQVPLFEESHVNPADDFHYPYALRPFYLGGWSEIEGRTENR